MASRELFSQSMYAQSAPTGNTNKTAFPSRETTTTTSSLPSSAPPSSCPISANSIQEKPSKRENPSEPGRPSTDREKERERMPETTQPATENSIGGKAPDPEKKKKKKKRRIRINSAGQSVSIAEEKVSMPEKEDFPVLEKKLREFNFYHGFLPREDLQSTLQNPGDYLLRVSEVVEGETKVNREVILSLIPVQVDGKDEEDKKKCRNVVIKRVSNKFFCETTRTFDSVADLVTYYTKNTGSCSAGLFQLKNPILQQPWEFMHSDVTVGKVLGEGAFGKVCAGSLKLKDGATVEVAIKMTKVSAFLSKMKIKEMMNEARFIRNFNHKNVVRLYGVAHDEQPLYILLELVKGGSLQDHLKGLAKKGTPASVIEKIKFCTGAARGIEYLHQHNCIHRDIAARNCLLHENVVKITDFGLSRTGPSYKIKTSCKLPVKWLAPETLTTFTFSYSTDVYSWGITCYEVFADGQEPYEGVSNAVCKADVLSSKFLQMPLVTPESVKKFISGFVFVEASRRSTMTEGANELDRIVSMNDMGTVDTHGTKQKIMKVFNKKKQKESKND